MFFHFKNLSSFSEITHFVTKRIGGCSIGSYASMNIGLGTDDTQELVIENRRILAQKVQLPLTSFVYLNQVHNDCVAVILDKDKGAGVFDKQTAIQQTDGAVTSRAKICLMTLGADCVPVLFYDPVKKIVGVCHSGWRGTVKRIAAKTVNTMSLEFGSNPDDIYVGIGPSIGTCCYEVGSEVIDAVIREFSTTEGFIRFDNETSKPIFDLIHTLKFQLTQIGVNLKHIETANICTQCNSNEYFSSRADKGVTGRFGAGIFINR